MPRYVVFLRGINLGGKRRVGMADLRAALDSEGFEDVRTLLQSGNVRPDERRQAEPLERELAKTLRRAFGFDIAVVAQDARRAGRRDPRRPVRAEADDPARYQVSFLSDKPSRRAAQELEAAATAPERAAVRGREVYAWHPGGVGRSELAKLITAKRLEVEVTARNWRTMHEATRAGRLARGWLTTSPARRPSAARGRLDASCPPTVPPISRPPIPTRWRGRSSPSASSGRTARRTSCSSGCGASARSTGRSGSPSIRRRPGTGR